ncbi:hypothetical protein EVAR_64725_1 [Eumeta japonica]|uniref:Uncharacterized protein n=1 Tax=Eumeta variegata TaxID=151549 RepID=A0A4C1ZYA2_EUMVA|nr:hypothetical protein EVAR_64725_1 [Eumeta japonica]
MVTRIRARTIRFQIRNRMSGEIIKLEPNAVGSSFTGNGGIRLRDESHDRTQIRCGAGGAARARAGAASSFGQRAGAPVLSVMRRVRQVAHVASRGRDARITSYSSSMISKLIRMPSELRVLGARKGLNAQYIEIYKRPIKCEIYKRITIQTKAINSKE